MYRHTRFATVPCGHNNSSVYDYTVYYYSDYTGPSQTVTTRYTTGNPTNLSPTLKNENASQKAVSVG